MTPRVRAQLRVRAALGAHYREPVRAVGGDVSDPSTPGLAEDIEEGPQRGPVAALRRPSSRLVSLSTTTVKNVLRPATTGPCNASPVQMSLGAAASNRLYVRGDGTEPPGTALLH